MYSFGNTSLKRLNSCHKDLIKIAKLAISRSRVDFGISEGFRSIAKQQEYYNAGKSQIDGINKKGNHNYYPSLAFDFYAYHSDSETRAKIAYDKCTLSYIAGILMSCASELLEKGEITHKLRWGGNWDMDGVILQDQSFDDLPHIELIKN